MRPRLYPDRLLCALRCTCCATHSALCGPVLYGHAVGMRRAQATAPAVLHLRCRPALISNDSDLLPTPHVCAPALCYIWPALVRVCLGLLYMSCV